MLRQPYNLSGLQRISRDDYLNMSALRAVERTFFRAVVARLNPRQQHARPASGASWTLDRTKYWKGWAHDTLRPFGEVRSVTGNASKRR